LLYIWQFNTKKRRIEEIKHYQNYRQEYKKYPILKKKKKKNKKKNLKKKNIKKKKYYIIYKINKKIN